MRLRVNKDQRVLVYKNGDYQRMLKPGTHRLAPYFGLPWGYTLEWCNVDERFEPYQNLKLFLDDPELAKELEVVEVTDKEVALHYADNRFVEVLTPGRYAFWEALKEHRFEHVDLTNPEVPEKIERSVLVHPDLTKLRQVAEVAGHEQGLLFFNGEFQRVLKPGRHFFWNGPTKVTVQVVDMRQLQLDISGQEILTRDKVTLRVNFVVQYKIVEPLKAVIEINDCKSQLYVLVQLALREYVGTFTLEELLQKKEEIGNFILDNVRDQGRQMGIEFIFAGVKDIILPGEMKAILSQVIEAEKKAQANIITRREETASTRSLLNTAKLMEDNPVLLRLKELEYIESIAGRIEKLSVTGSSPLIEQLGSIFSAAQSVNKG